MRPPAGPTKAGPRGRCTHHKTCRILDLPKEIRDLYHGIYLPRRLPSPPSCGCQQREEAIQDILSSLRDCLHRWGYTATPKGDIQEADAESQSRPRRREDLHDEALQKVREAHQWTLEAAHMLEWDIKRLCWGEGMPNTPDPMFAAVATHRVNLWIDVQGPQACIDQRGE